MWLVNSTQNNTTWWSIESWAPFYNAVSNSVLMRACVRACVCVHAFVRAYACACMCTRKRDKHAPRTQRGVILWISRVIDRGTFPARRRIRTHHTAGRCAHVLIADRGVGIGILLENYFKIRCHADVTHGGGAQVACAGKSARWYLITIHEKMRSSMKKRPYTY